MSFENDSQRVGSVYLERARRLARTPSQSATPGLRVLFFRVGGVRLALDLGAIREVQPAGQLTRIPGAPPPLDCVTQVRGQIYPLVDLAALLKLDASEAQPANVLLLRRQRREIAIQVGAVEGVGTIDPGLSHRVESNEETRARFLRRGGADQPFELSVEQLFSLFERNSTDDPIHS